MPEQVLCVRCAAIVAEEERLQRALREVLPPNLRLYDFGDSQTVMPIPDFEGQGTYLTSCICYIEEPGTGKYMGVELRYNRDAKSKELLDTTNIIEQLKKAVPTFSEKAVAFKYASDREHRVR